MKLWFHKVHFNYRVLGKSFYIYNKGEIILGRSVSLNSYPNGSSYRTALSTYFPEAKIVIGDNCNINGTVIHSNELIQIGNKCMFGPGTIICDNDSHRVSKDPVVRRTKAVSKPIIIGDNVWVGMNCMIMKGVNIGENAIVAAGSLVLHDVEANTVVGGNPAKFIKELKD
jgi:acetyltransferase-like isoleucine patch superfamily enzyme